MSSYEIDGLVGNDFANPRLQGTLALIVEPLDGGQNLHETVLNDIFYIIEVRDIPQSCGYGISLVAFIEPPHSLTVSTPHAFQQLLLSFQRCLLFFEYS